MTKITSTYSNFVSKKFKSYRQGYQPLLKLTQKDMGDLIGIGQSFYSQMERGAADVTHGAICTMADVYHVSPLEIDPNILDPQRFRYIDEEYFPKNMLYLARNSLTNVCIIGNSSKDKPPVNFKLQAVWPIGENSDGEILNVIAYLINNNGMSKQGDVLLNNHDAEKLIDSYFFDESEDAEASL